MENNTSTENVIRKTNETAFDKLSLYRKVMECLQNDKQAPIKVFVVMHMANDYDISSSLDSVYSERKLAEIRVEQIDREWEEELEGMLEFIREENTEQHLSDYVPTRPTVPEIVEVDLDRGIEG